MLLVYNLCQQKKKVDFRGRPAKDQNAFLTFLGGNKPGVAKSLFSPIPKGDGVPLHGRALHGLLLQLRIVLAACLLDLLVVHPPRTGVPAFAGSPMLITVYRQKKTKTKISHMLTI